MVEGAPTPWAYVQWHPTLHVNLEKIPKVSLCLLSAEECRARQQAAMGEVLVVSSGQGAQDSHWDFPIAGDALQPNQSAHPTPT